jgi:hypothetical protein
LAAVVVEVLMVDPVERAEVRSREALWLSRLEIRSHLLLGPVAIREYSLLPGQVRDFLQPFQLAQQRLQAMVAEQVIKGLEIRSIQAVELLQMEPPQLGFRAE